MLIALIHKKLQAVVFFFEVLQKNLLRFAVGLFHIIDPELAEVARHDPSRTLRVGQLGGIPFGLLERIEQAAIRLFDRCTEVFLNAFLLNHHVRARDIRINKRGMVKPNLLLEMQPFVHVFRTKDLRQ